uniref:Advillin n=1 Tax=Terrapene triunguis TaxID=2587831 RepID=A0A674IA68_9SAUR
MGSGRPAGESLAGAFPLGCTPNAPFRLSCWWGGGGEGHSGRGAVVCPMADARTRGGCSGLNALLPPPQKMDLVQVPPKSHGSFYEGDCYVLLSTRRSGSVLAYDIHYWVGKSSSRDEQGCAAICTTQLDDYLGGGPVQHREVQGHESDLFKGYFKQGIIYKKGGVASGMTHVETNVYNVRRLLHVKGRRNVTATEVEMSWDSFNLGDVFLLDLGKVIIQWNGPESNTRERLKVGTSLDLPHPAWDSDYSFRCREGKFGAFPSLDLDRNQRPRGERPGSRSLAYWDCYILDHAGTKIYVWKGKGATKAERQTAMAKALEFINMKGYPYGTNVETVNDGAESAMFKQLFQTWAVRDQTVGLGKAYSAGKVGKEEPPLSWSSRRARLPSPQPAGRGRRSVWRIENLELAPVESQWHGFFYGGDCYLVLYTYGVNHQPRYILYIWQGRHATPDELAASAYQAVEVDRQFDGEPVQVRVSMGKEPRHFLAIFKGKLVIFEGGTSRTSSNEPEPPVRLFQIHGTDQSNTKAVEVPAFASSLNSNDVFLLRTQTEHYLWYGKVRGSHRAANPPASGPSPCATDSECQLVSLPARAPETVAEGQEPAVFWEVLGGKAPYATVCCRLQQEVPDNPPRLFECSNKTGRFVVTEVTDFGQDDLSESDVMLLDTWDQVFLWLGTDANATEKEAALATAWEYLHTHPSGRDTDTPILVVKQGFEPPTFTGWFVAWDPHKWSVSINKVEA